MRLVRIDEEEEVMVGDGEGDDGSEKQRRIFLANCLLSVFLECVGHMGHAETGLYYNGQKHDDIPNSPHLGIDRKRR